MSAAVKAAILSVGLIVLIVAGYFVFTGGGGDVTTELGESTLEMAAHRAERDPERTPSRDTDLIDIPDRGSVAVEVEVVAADGRPLSKSRLKVVKVSDADRNRGAIVHDLPTRAGARGGNFEFQLPPGTYEFQARCRGYAGEDRDVLLVNGQDPLKLLFELDSGTGISGRVLTEDGSPIPGAEVAAFRKLAAPDADLEETLRAIVDLEKFQQEIHHTAISAPDGTYQIDGLKSVWYSVRAVAKGFSPGTVASVLAPREGVDVRLATGGVLEGIVRASNGSPIEGAEVEAFSELEEAGLFEVILNKSRPPVDKQSTDSAGGFQLSQLGVGLYNFRVRAGGYQEYTEMKFRVSSGENPLKEFVLDLGFAVRGVVLDPDDQPLEGAKVRVSEVGGRSQRDQVNISFEGGDIATDENGTFAFDTLKDTSYMLMVWHDDYQSLQRRDVRPSDEELVINLPIGGQMQGTVLDTATGQPIPGAVVSVADVANVRKERVTDQGGDYFLSGLNTSRRNLTVYVKAKGYARARRQVKVHSNRKIQEDFELQGTATVSGRVTYQGEEIAGAHVEARRFQADTNTPQIVGSGKTDVDGVFVITDVEPGAGMRIRVKKKTFLDGYSDEFTVNPGEQYDTDDIPLKLGGGVEGRVSASDGRPIAGCMVEARSPADTEMVKGHGTASVHTGADGSYRIQGLESGFVEIIFKAPKYVEVSLANIEVREGHQNIDQDIVLETAGVLTGFVFSADGGAVVNAEVVVRDFTDGVKEHRAVSNGSGEFSITSLASKDEVDLEVIHADYSSYEKEKVAVGDGVVEVVLDPLGRIKATVLDPDGQPVVNFSVQPQVAAGGKRNRKPLKSRNFTDGSFDYRGVSDGEYDVSIRSLEHSVYTAKSVEVKAGEVVDLGEIILREGGRVTGRVVEAGTGKAIGGAKVSVVQGRSKFQDRTQSPVFYSKENGSFLFSGLRDGAVTLEVSHDDYSVQRIEDVTGDEDLVVELGAGIEISGTVRDADGNPLSGMTVYLMTKGGGAAGKTAKVGAGGGYNFKGVAAGTYTIKAHKFQPGGKNLMTETEVTIGDGDILDDLDLVVEEAQP